MFREKEQTTCKKKKNSLTANSSKATKDYRKDILFFNYRRKNTVN